MASSGRSCASVGTASPGPSSCGARARPTVVWRQHMPPLADHGRRTKQWRGHAARGVVCGERGEVAVAAAGVSSAAAGRSARRTSSPCRGRGGSRRGQRRRLAQGQPRRSAVVDRFTRTRHKHEIHRRVGIACLCGRPSAPPYILPHTTLLTQHLGARRRKLADAKRILLERLKRGDVVQAQHAHVGRKALLRRRRRVGGREGEVRNVDVLACGA